jgi:hypothetical protein
MATHDQRVDGWTVVLRRQPARMVEGRAEGGYTDVFELICCDCGDDPGPYPVADGIRAYEQHFRLHQQLGVTTGRGRWPMLAERR